MTKEYNQGFKEAEKEFKERLSKEVKQQTLHTLERLEKEKANKANSEENIRILKMDLDDLKEGRLDKIKERQEKSSQARAISEIDLEKFGLSLKFHPSKTTTFFQGSGSMVGSETFLVDASSFMTYTSGTYPTSSRTYYIS
jgi:DNA relaxase NicK